MRTGPSQASQEAPHMSTLTRKKRPAAKSVRWPPFVLTHLTEYTVSHGGMWFTKMTHPVPKWRPCKCGKWFVYNPQAQISVFLNKNYLHGLRL
eukprot:g33267.t1